MKNNRKNLIVNYYVTLNCNLKCSYCIVYDNIFGNSGGDFSSFFKRLASYNERYKFFNKIFIEFFGGEPLLKRKYICGFLERLENSFFYTITTNGLIFDDYVKFIYDNVFAINISIHIYNLSKIRFLLGKFERYKEKMAFTLVIDKHNIKSYYSLVKSFLKFGFRRLNILPVFLKYNRYKDDLNNLFKLVKYINDFKYFNIDFLYYNPVKKDYEISILPDGNIYGFNGEIIYNKLLREKFFIGTIDYLRSIKDFFELYYNIVRFKLYHESLSLNHNAALRIGVAKENRNNFKQSISNYIKVNKFLEFLKKYLSAGK